MGVFPPTTFTGARKTMRLPRLLRLLVVVRLLLLLRLVVTQLLRRVARLVVMRLLLLLWVRKSNTPRTAPFLSWPKTIFPEPPPVCN